MVNALYDNSCLTCVAGQGEGSQHGCPMKIRFIYLRFCQCDDTSSLQVFVERNDEVG